MADRVAQRYAMVTAKKLVELSYDLVGLQNGGEEAAP